MRILQVNKFYFHRGGAESYMFALTRLLEQHGHEVVTFSCDFPESRDTPYRRFFVSPIITERPKWGWEGLRTAARFLWSHQAARNLHKLLQTEQVDVAHLHNIYHQISPSILSVFSRRRIPVVMTLHDFHLVSPAYNLSAHGTRCAHTKGGRWFQAVLHRCVKNSFAASALCATELTIHRMLKLYETGIDAFIAPSQFLAAALHEWGFVHPSITVIPNFIERSRFHITPAHARTVHYLGRLSEEKGIRTLLNVIERLPAVQFVIAGDGPGRSAVEKFIQGHHNVNYRGSIYSDEVPTFLDQTGVLVVPSLAPEVLPMSVLEAQAAGRPVVAFASGGIPEIISNGVNGELVREGDTEGFARAIKCLVEDQDKRMRQGQAARENAKRFDAELHYQSIMNIYEQVIKNYDYRH